MAQTNTKVNIEMARVNVDLANETKILARASKEDSAVMRTAGCLTSILTCMKFVFVRKGEQGCFIAVLGELR